MSFEKVVRGFETGRVDWINGSPSNFASATTMTGAHCRATSPAISDTKTAERHSPDGIIS